MDKKIIALIIGIILILAGLIGWKLIKPENIDEQNLQEVTVKESEIKSEEENKIEETEQKEEAKAEETDVRAKKEIKPHSAPKPTRKILINLVEPEIEGTPMFEESLVEKKSLEDPYVDEDGNIVVQNEFRPPLKEKIKFQGVIYTIKTRIIEAKETAKN